MMAFSVSPAEVTERWLEEWRGLLDTPLPDYPKQLGLSLLAQLGGRIAPGHPLLLVPLRDGTWSQEVLDRILALTPEQRLAAAECLRFQRDLGDPSAQRAWTQLWSEIYGACGGLDPVWLNGAVPSRSGRWFYSRTFATRVAALEASVRSAFQTGTARRPPTLPVSWKGLGGIPPEQFPQRLAWAMLAQLENGRESPIRLMLIPAPSLSNVSEVCGHILRLDKRQRSVTAEALQLWRDIGNGSAARACALLWDSVGRAGGDLPAGWAQPTGEGACEERSYVSPTVAAIVDNLAEEVRCAFALELGPEESGLPDDWEGLASVAVQKFPVCLGRAILRHLWGWVSQEQKMLLLPKRDGSNANLVRDRLGSLSPRQALAVAHYVGFRATLGGGLAREAWETLWREVEIADGDIDSVWEP